MSAPALRGAALAQAIDDALPQTQCTRCGYPDCRAYAEAIAHDGAPVNQCPPGGQEGVRRLAAQPATPLNPRHGQESPRRWAEIDEDWCIGCTLCLQACPVDCIVGGPKWMHTVLTSQCTGCELCLPACPVDCIVMQVSDRPEVGWHAWSEGEARQARTRYRWHQLRLERDDQERTERLAAQSPEAVAASVPAGDAPLPQASAVVLAALARARATRGA
jgi:electron transport complex protein RnfB